MITILNNIFDNFMQITQWLPSETHIASKYIQQAESLIELLEIEDCGSVGGFDSDNPIRRESKFKLYDRFMALVRKYDDEKNISDKWEFDIYQLQKYFIVIHDLRDKIKSGEIK